MEDINESVRSVLQAVYLYDYIQLTGETSASNMLSERPKDALNQEQPRKRSSITRFMMPFRTKDDSPANSINNSPRSSMDVSYPDEIQPRKLSKAFSTKSGSKVSIKSSDEIKPANKLRKNSSLAPKVTLGEVRDKVTGEMKDPTNMLHVLAHDFDAPSSGKQPILETGEPKILAADFVRRLPTSIWQRIISHLDLAEEATLSLTTKAFRDLCNPDVLRLLRHPDNFRARCDFLNSLNYALPNHLLCYICGVYHVRSQNGAETLRPSNIANPLFDCPYATSNIPAEKQARHRITFGRNLPYTFVQLPIRYHRYGEKFGLHYDKLGRRYKDKESIGKWYHQTRWAIIDDHLYMRVVSHAFVQPNLPPAGMRHLLYTREDFTPFFSVCAHWRDGNLMPSCKCALTHVPAPLEGGGAQRLARELSQKLHGPKGQMVSMCEKCKPMRRCPDCPTEYLIEVRVQEDRDEKDPTKLFKHAIVVTRWSDLGDGSAPWNREWAALQGDLDHLDKQERFDSFKVLGRRAISGKFESFFNPEQIPPQRLISMNPDGKKLGEKGHDWY